MSSRPNPRRGDKKRIDDPILKKSHSHKPKKGKGHYKRKGKRGFKRVKIEDILESEYEDL